LVFIILLVVSDNDIVLGASNSSGLSHLGDDLECLIRDDSVLDGVDVDILNLPLLVQFSMLLPDNDVGSILILCTLNIDNESSLVDNKVAIEAEVLEPSSIGLVTNQIS